LVKDGPFDGFWVEEGVLESVGVSDNVAEGVWVDEVVGVSDNVAEGV
jgi:hypothetical protein